MDSFILPLAVLFVFDLEALKHVVWIRHLYIINIQVVLYLCVSIVCDFKYWFYDTYTSCSVFSNVISVWLIASQSPTRCPIGTTGYFYYEY